MTFAPGLNTAEKIKDSFTAQQVETVLEISQSTDKATHHEQPKPTVVKRDEEYKALEAVVKSAIYGGVESIGQQGGALIQFLVIQKATRLTLEGFIRWYKAKNQNAALPRQIKRIKGTDDFEGKFVTHWQEWQIAAAPKVTPRPVVVEQELTPEARAEMLAMIGGVK